MARLKTYQVKDNRIRYICSSCKSKRSIPIPPHIRSRSVQCHNCGYVSRCNLNRRHQQREKQTGKITMFLSGGRELTIDLNDISPNGIGASVKPGTSNIVSLRDEVKFKCGWNPRLIAHGRYVVKSIKGNRIGIQNIAPKAW